MMDADDTNDLINLICGRKLGEGTFRTVFECALDKTRVVKHDSGSNFSNINEWQLSNELAATSLASWIAPVYWLSPRGLWLIQAKTTPITLDQLPEKIPAIFADTKVENWGLFEGRPVCHDYGNHRAFVLAGKAGMRMRAANWIGTT
ncbi:hypothetical protein OPV09_17455 [Janthinobacterium sp. TB1-E2]|uniref:Uncharacterized protein n=1 Tax=Janthinobacterium aestuarii TaxID=2985511 RepID=A0ABZ2GFW9_9BURK